MKLIIERHEYAPELNKVFVFHKRRQVAVINAAGVRNISEARRLLFPQYVPAVVGYLEKTNTMEPALLNSKRAGLVDSRQQALQIARDWREKSKGGPLVDGRVLPDSVVTVKTRLVWVKK